MALPGARVCDRRSHNADVYYHGVESITSFVLAGGKSSRMGRDKAFMQVGGRTLLAQVLELANRATGNAWIVGGKEKFAAFGPVIEDTFPGQGPLAGIHAALAETRTELNLMIAVDMPFVRADFLDYLAAQASESAAVVVVPRTNIGFQPLCAVYRRAFADVAERSLRAGKNKVDRLFSEVKTRVIEPEELEQGGFGDEMFRNLNTGKDWQEATEKLSTR
jgi:molybdopterin-guanine dinucleotide biosynthesis protein A